MSSSAANPDAPSEVSAVRILVASEDAATTEFLESSLRTWGFAAHCVTDGLEALRYLMEAATSQIAILDGALPKLGGVDIAAQVQSRSIKQRVWAMVLCDQADTSMIQSAIDAGVDDLVLKPIDGTDLRIRVSVAERVQTLMNRLDLQSEATRFEVEHDPVTGLLNREALLRMLFAETDRVQRLKTPLALVLLDLDHFSALNKKYGYEAGDKLLKELAKRLRRHLRSYDLVGRAGDDEFLIALPGCDAGQASVAVQRMKRSILDRPFPVHRDQVKVTASAGISLSQGRSPLVVLREAERALAEAKASGGNCERMHGNPAGAPAELKLVPAVAKKEA